MIEIAFISLVIINIALLVYGYVSEKHRLTYIEKLQSMLSSLPTEMQKFYTDLSHKEQLQTQKTLSESFTKFLKHIEKLETMVLPKPVTTKAVQDVFDRVGEITDSGKFENEIENEKEKGVTIQDDVSWTSLIDANTKVQVEGEEEPTIIE